MGAVTARGHWCGNHLCKRKDLGSREAAHLCQHGKWCRYLHNAHGVFWGEPECPQCYREKHDLGEQRSLRRRAILAGFCIPIPETYVECSE